MLWDNKNSSAFQQVQLSFSKSEATWYWRKPICRVVPRSHIQWTFWLKEKLAKRCTSAVTVGDLGSGIIRVQDPLAPLQRFSHLIYTDLRGHQFWIKIGKNLPIGSTKCSLHIAIFSFRVFSVRQWFLEVDNAFHTQMTAILHLILTKVDIAAMCYLPLDPYY